MMERDRPALKAYDRTDVSGSARVHQGDHIGDVHAVKIEHHYYNVSPAQSLPTASVTQRKPFGRGFALLCLSGTTEDAVANLEWLKQFMKRVGQLQHQQKPPKPCEYFDLIGGKNAGGLITVLLGPLQLKVEQAIEICRAAYDIMLVHKTTQDSAKPVAQKAPDLWQASLKMVVQQLQSYGYNAERPFFTNDAVSCKVFVRLEPLQDRNAELLRSYSTAPNTSSLDSMVTIKSVLSTIIEQETAAYLLSTTRQSVVDRLVSPPFDVSAQTWHEARLHLADIGQDLAKHLDLFLCLGSNNGSAGKSQQREGQTDVWSALNQAMPTITFHNRFHRFDLQAAMISRQSFHSEPHNGPSKQTAAALHFEAELESPRFADFMANGASHQINPGFAIIKYADMPMTSSTKNSTPEVSLPKLISDYDSRIAHWRRSQPRIRGTCNWIHDNPKFKAWNEVRDDSILLCTGEVGCGKSFIAAAMIDYLAENSSNIRDCIHYFFDESLGSEISLNACLRALLKQLVSPDSAESRLPVSLYDELKRAFSDISQPPTNEKLTSLLGNALRESQNTIVVIDGFDCLEEAQILDFFAMVRELLRTCSSCQCKLALFCRNHLGRGIYANLQLQSLRCVHGIHIRLHHVEQDIRKFVEQSVANNQLRRQITHDESLIDEIKTTLISHSGKMFLWIDLQVRTLWDPTFSTSDQDLREQLLDLPVGLDETYGRCLKRIRDLGRLTVATRTFCWLMYARQPLTNQQAREIASIDPSKIDLPRSRIINTCVTDYCGNLVTTDATKSYVHFTHPSVKKYLQKLNKEDTANSWISEALVTGVCLSYISMLQTRKQIVLRSHVRVPGNTAETFLQGVPGKSGMAVLTYLFGRRSRTRDYTLPATESSTTDPTRQLELHSYIVRQWLWHSRSIMHTDPYFETFCRICLSPDQEIMPWLAETVTGSTLYGSLAHRAILEEHGPLLDVVLEEIARKRKELIHPVLRSDVPGMSVQLAHVAATLGHVGIMEKLGRHCDWDVMDKHRKTPLAWAILNERTDAVVYLLNVTSVSRTRCMWLSHGYQAFYLDWLSVIAVYTFSPWRDSVYKQIMVKCSMTKDYAASLSRALYCACRLGFEEPAQWLCSIGADPNVFSKFGNPIDSTNARESVAGNTLSIMVRSRDKRAAQILLRVGATKNALKNTSSSSILFMLADCRMESRFQDLYRVLDEEYGVPVATQYVPVYLTTASDSHFLSMDIFSLDNGCLEHTLAMRHSSRALSAVMQNRKRFGHVWLTNEDGYTALDYAAATHNAESMDILVCRMQIENCVDAENAKLSKAVQRAIEEHLRYVPLIAEVQTCARTLSIAPPPDYLALRCLRRCNGSLHRSAEFWRVMHKHKFDGDFALGSPTAYWRIGWKCVLKPSYVGAIYRWNWHLRRRKKRPLSRADVAYMRAVPEVLLPRDSRMLSQFDSCYRLASKGSKLEVKRCIQKYVEYTREWVGT